MLLLLYALVEAPDEGWGSGRTVGGLVGAAVLLLAFVINEARRRSPLMPLSIFRVRGLAPANATQLITFAGFLAMFFFLTLYMQSILGYSPIKTGLAYLPVCFVIGISAGIASTLITKVGTRPLVVGGALIGAVGVGLFSRIPVDGSYVTDLLPGMVIMSIGIGAVFVAVINAANAGVPSDQAGLAAALLNSSQQVGGALGLAVLSAIATSRTNGLLTDHVARPEALVEGFQRGLLVGSIFLFATAVIAMRTTNTHELQE
jgi:predicted MFS family arabinose efflux permease